MGLLDVALILPRSVRKRGIFKQRYQEAILDTLDMLSPAFDSPMTWREVDRVLNGVGAKSWEFATRVPINVIGRR